jgi:hypothetical protein
VVQDGVEFVAEVLGDCFPGLAQLLVELLGRGMVPQVAVDDRARPRTSVPTGVSFSVSSAASACSKIFRASASELARRRTPPRLAIAGRCPEHHLVLRAARISSVEPHPPTAKLTEPPNENSHGFERDLD